MAAEVRYPVRFYLVLCALALGIGGLWVGSMPINPPYLPPSPAARAMLEHAMQQAEQVDAAEHCRNDGDF